VRAERCGGPVFDRTPFNDEVSAFNPEPLYDEDPFVDHVCDVALGSDNAAVTVLSFAQSAYVVHDQETDDIDDGPVYDNCDDGLVFDTEPVPNGVAVAVLD
jgi:hypothetical protein